MQRYDTNTMFFLLFYGFIVDIKKGTVDWDVLHLKYTECHLSNFPVF